MIFRVGTLILLTVPVPGLIRSAMAEGDDPELIRKIQGEYARANAAIGRGTSDPSAYVRRGILAGRLGRYDLAVADADRAIRLNPNSADAYFLCGVAHARRGDVNHARQDAARVLELAPDYPGAAQLRDWADGQIRGSGRPPSPAATAVKRPDRGSMERESEALDSEIRSYTEQIEKLERLARDIEGSMAQARNGQYLSSVAAYAETLASTRSDIREARQARDDAMNRKNELRSRLR